MCLLLYVIDMLNTSNNMSEINNLKDRFSGDFEMKDLGVAKKKLGMEMCSDQSAN